MEHGGEFKFHHQTFVRSTSLPYCGSETESELYAPYGFYTGDEVRSLGISPTGRGRSREISTCSGNYAPVSKIFTYAATAIRLQNTPKNYVNRWFPGYSKNFSPVESRLISKSLFRHKFSPFSYDLKSEKAATQARFRSRGPNIAEQCRLQSTIRAEHCRSVPIE